ncbi:MAG: arylsulfatase, partial [Bryobacteraceae bacterium]
ELHEAIFWEHEGNKAIHQGQWKLVSRYPDKWELYDLRQDRTELHDRAADLPKKVTSLEAQWRDWANRSNVVPWNQLKHGRH